MIDNLKLIEPFINEEKTDNEVYSVQLIVRKKDHPRLKDRDNVIKWFSFYNFNALKLRYAEIKSWCDEFQARAYLQLTPRDEKIVSIDMLDSLIKLQRNGCLHKLKSLYRSCADQNHGIRYKKYWFFDIDIIDGKKSIEVTRATNNLIREEEFSSVIDYFNNNSI